MRSSYNKFVFVFTFIIIGCLAPLNAQIRFSNVIVEGNSLTQDSVEQSKFEDSIFAPMHGIIKINNLKIKNRVKKGDVLLKLEAMKMEYSLIAPRDGIIKEIFCKNGEQVTENSKLLNLEKIK